MGQVETETVNSNNDLDSFKKWRPIVKLKKIRTLSGQEIIPCHSDLTFPSYLLIRDAL